ncbi:response regulator transcription factor [Mixta mediterraneensis]|uniref:response regulator transcription factor n=1 Tax=Mixta mediterraneensis TaxID=2758443 RepID=UPI0018745F7D|nr:LuxR C-terminal-related transcriptional regulator [Mixta mediterraneensis]MBE5254489.1 response regulator transcription factor [Mixta mediterraneensis]
MKAFLFSDDAFFSQGLKSLLATEKISLQVGKWTSSRNVHLSRRQFRHGDTIMLDASDSRFVKKSITFPVWNCKVNLLIFHHPQKNTLPCFNACQHVPKNLSSEEMLKLIQNFMAHDNHLSYFPGILTPREKEIMHLIYRQWSQKEISQKMNISLKTVSAHKVKALKKLGVRNFSELYY